MAKMPMQMEKTAVDATSEFTASSKVESFDAKRYGKIIHIYAKINNLTDGSTIFTMNSKSTPVVNALCTVYYFSNGKPITDGAVWNQVNTGKMTYFGVSHSESCAIYCCYIAH